MYAIVNGKLILNEEIIENKIIVFNEKIIKIINEEELKKFSNVEIIDAEDNYISPGFIDIHLHGFSDFEIMSGNDIDKISIEIAKYGITSFLGATMTERLENIEKILKILKNSVSKTNGAEFMGVYLEGPFLSKKYKGAHREEFIIKPDIKFIEKYRDIIKIVVFAPENDTGNNFIEKLLDLNIIGALGHTGCDYELAMDNFNRGANLVTHIFNAMPQIHHRIPGFTVAALNSDAYCELIADNVHVDKKLYNMLLKIKGIDKIVLVSDAIKYAGLKEGEYFDNDKKIYIKDKKAFFENGTILGGVTPLNECFKNFIDELKLPVEKGIKCITENLAKVLKIYGKKGVIREGADADIVILDKNIEIKNVFVKGKKIK